MHERWGQSGFSHVTLGIGRLGSEGFWVSDYRGGVPGRPPFWRTLNRTVKGLTPVALKINTRHTYAKARDAVD